MQEPAARRQNKNLLCAFLKAELYVTGNLVTILMYV